MNLITLPKNNELAISQPITNAEQIKETLGHSKATNTKNVYTRAWIRLTKYFLIQGWETSPETDIEHLEFIQHLISYLQTLNDGDEKLGITGVRYSSIMQTFGAAKDHIGCQNENAYQWFEARNVRRFLSGVRRKEAGTLVAKKEALTLEQLKGLDTLSKTDEPSIKELRDLAIIFVQVAAAMRSSEICGLTFADIEPSTKVKGYTLTLRKSKTDQTGAGRRVTIRESRLVKGDAVKILRAYLSAMEEEGFSKRLSPSSALFPRMHGECLITVKGSKGKVLAPILSSSKGITKILREALLRGGLLLEGQQIEDFASHSPRATFVTLNFAADVPVRKIQAITGHKSLTVLEGYNRNSGEEDSQTDWLTENPSQDMESDSNKEEETSTQGNQN